MQIEVEKLSGRDLDYWVNRVERKGYRRTGMFSCAVMSYCPSTDWAQGGPIIEREGIMTNRIGADWHAVKAPAMGSGSTLLEAAMRCYVMLKFGAVILVDGQDGTGAVSVHGTSSAKIDEQPAGPIVETNREDAWL